MGAESDNLVKTIKEGLKVFSRKDDDTFDRLSNRYTIAFLVFCSLFLASKTYVGEPIKCFTPKEFHDNWVKYADNYCWIKNTYYVPFDENLPLPLDHKDFREGRDTRRELPYYQWVPLILAFMIATFGIPVGVWHVAMKTSGYSIEGIVKLTTKADNVDPDNRDAAVKYIASQLRRNIGFHRSTAKGLLKIGNGYGLYLYLMYIFTKLLYIGVAIFLLAALNYLMGEGYWDYGIRAMRGIIDDGEYIENPMFPRITFCDYKVRRLGGNIHPYTVQCVLTVNLFNERIFLVIWWWFVILACLGVVGLLVFLAQTLMPGANYQFIMKYLHLQEVADRTNHRDRDLVKVFTSNFLRQDGVFCMRLIAKNVPDVVGAEIVSQLYKAWLIELKKEETPRESAPLLNMEGGELPSKLPQEPNDYPMEPISDGRAKYLKAAMEDY